MVKFFLAGGDGSGKSTLASSLSLLFNIPVFSFGDCVRNDLVSNFGYSFDELKKKPTPYYIRNILRSHGQSMKKLHGNDFWVNKFKILHSGVDSYIVDDMRFKVEYDFARSVNGQVFFLKTFFDPNTPTFEDLKFIELFSDYSFNFLQ